MPSIEKLREYTNTVCSQIRWKKAHNPVSEEIENHLLDQRDVYIQEGVTEEEATDKAIADMGDPVGVGTQLDRVHKPKPQWGLLVLTLVMVLMGIIFQTLLQWDVQIRFRIPALAGYHLKFAITGIIALGIAYATDFSIIGKYPKAAYFALLLLFGLSFVYSPIAKGAVYYAIYCSLLFPVAFSGIVYAMRGKGYWGIAVCSAAGLFPAFLALMVPTAAGFSLIIVSGAAILGYAVWRNWFMSPRLQSYLLAYLPFLGGAVVFAFAFLRTSYTIQRIEAFLHPERDPLGGGYVAIVIQNLLANAKWLGGGVMPARFAESQRFPLSSVHNDFMLTYIIYRWGWLPFGLILVLFLVFIVWGFRQCLSQKSVLGQLVAGSALLTFTLQAIQYIIYNLGILLLAPLSLPLLSYGLSGLVVNMVLIGLMLSVFRNGSAVRDRKLPSSPRQPFISWQDHKLVIDFSRGKGD